MAEQQGAHSFAPGVADRSVPLHDILLRVTLLHSGSWPSKTLPQPHVRQDYRMTDSLQ
jgi:hypothetical protein